MKNHVYFFDTTLRDGEQSPGATMNLQEKLRLAHQLEVLGVDIIEAGFPASSPGDFESVRRIAEQAGDIQCIADDFSFTFHSKVRRIMESRGAEVLARDAEGNPLFFRSRYGKGTVYTFAYGIERAAFSRTGSFSTDIWKLYRKFLGKSFHIVSTDDPLVLCSDHLFDDNKAASLVYNCSSKELTLPLNIAPNWNIESRHSDSETTAYRDGKITLPPGTGICFVLSRNLV